MAVSISVSIAQNSQNITGNTSNVTVKVTAKWTNGSYNALVNSSGTPQAHGWLKIDGTSYDFASTFNTGKTTSGSQTIFTKTVNVSHNSDGTKTLSCSASYTTGVSSGTVTASASKTLTTIPRKSTLSVSNGTLDTEQTLTVTRQSTSFTHTITATCGDESETICTKSTSTSIKFTPPLSWASQKTDGTSVSVEFTITTYNGNTSLGSNSYTKSCSIPSSVKPSVTFTVAETTPSILNWGTFVQYASKLKIEITASQAYGSAIKSYKTTVDGKTYTASSFTTSVLQGSGSLTITATVTDNRGRTGTATQTIQVFPYYAPQITAFSVHRCNEDGTENMQGEFGKVNFTCQHCPIINEYGFDNNSKDIQVAIKKTSDEDYTTIYAKGMEEYISEVISDEVIFPAVSGSSYNVKISVFDIVVDDEEVTKQTVLSTGFSIIHWLSNGLGLAFGKLAETTNVLDIGFLTRFMGGILHPVLEPETDLDDMQTPNTYVGANVSTHNYGNCPLTTGTFTLEVVGMGEEGQVKQRLTYCHKTASRAWERIYHSTDGVMSWGEWVCVSDYDGQLLWDDCYYMTAGHTATLAEAVSKQKNGIVLVFSEYIDGAVSDTAFHTRFIPKKFVATHPGKGHCFQLSSSNLDHFATKYLYISDEKIVGHDNNGMTGTGDCGITFNNKRFVLRYVIGV